MCCIVHYHYTIVLWNVEKKFWDSTRTFSHQAFSYAVMVPQFPNFMKLSLYRWSKAEPQCISIEATTIDNVNENGKAIWMGIYIIVMFHTRINRDCMYKVSIGEITEMH